MKILSLENNRFSLAVRITTSIAVYLSFVYSRAFFGLGFAYSLPYNFNISMNVWVVMFLYGLVFFVVYHAVSAFFCRILLGLQKQDVKVSRDTFKQNLDIAFFVANLLLGTVSIAYFFNVEAYLIGRIFISKIATLFAVLLFYLLIKPRLKSDLQKPALVLSLFMGALLFVVS